MTIPEIEQIVRSQSFPERRLIQLLERDRRAGVRRLGIQQLRRIDREKREAERLERMLEVERRFWGRGIEFVAGVDEVGRGCLAGPVVAAAVIFPPRASIESLGLEGLDDSKKVAPDVREVLFKQIEKAALAIGTGQVEADGIDDLNILEATMLAMRMALGKLDPSPQQVLVDGNRTPAGSAPELAVIDGDGRSISIAAASIVAKVTRDRIMAELGKSFPEYGFAQHKGYGSSEHLRALMKHGPCSLHRRSFGPVADLLPGAKSESYRILAAGLEQCANNIELRRMGVHIKEASSADLSDEELKSLRRIYKRRSRQFNLVGSRGEAVAADFLEANGFRILERGYRGAGGEIDLVVRAKGALVFVEVKSSEAGSVGEPVDRLNKEKRRHLLRAARHYLQRHRRTRLECRFDVIAVRFSGGRAEVSHVENAFQADS